MEGIFNENDKSSITQINSIGESGDDQSKAFLLIFQDTFNTVILLPIIIH